MVDLVCTNKTPMNMPRIIKRPIPLIHIHGLIKYSSTEACIEGMHAVCIEGMQLIMHANES